MDGDEAAVYAIMHDLVTLKTLHADLGASSGRASETLMEKTVAISSKVVC